MIIPICKMLRSDAPNLALAECDILSQVVQREYSPIRIVFFTNVSSNEEYLQQRGRILNHCDKMFGEQKPMVALVAQPPLEATLLAEVTYVEPSCKVEYHSDYILLNDCQLFTAGLGAELEDSIGSQSDKIFHHLEQILAAEGFLVSDIVRQWNYIENITHISAQGQNYQQFNDARSRFYGRVEWQNGYPAATGIGSNWGGVIVVVDALKQSTQYSRAIDNPLQLSAHNYSQQVLIEGDDPQRKTTPKFERARWVGDSSSGMIYISGTAAIRGEASLRENIMQQSVMTLENIEYLISPDNQLRNGVPCVAQCKYGLLRIYVKRQEDWLQIKDWIQENCLCEDIIPVMADICRSELLIEIGGVAIATQ